MENNNSNIVITENNFIALVNIYNTFLQLHTCGEESFSYTDAMRALKKVLQEIDNKRAMQGG